MTCFLYLDIDGVIIPNGRDPKSVPFAFAARLRRILDATGAKIVVSSHRRIAKFDVLNMLTAAGFTHHDFAPNWTTPHLLTPSSDASIRGQEIAQHLLDNRPAKFVIVDDSPVLPSHAPHFVQPNPDVGLTDDDADLAIAILAKE